MPKLKIFVSCSGKKSEAVANSLCKWIPLIVPGTEFFFAKKDINGGSIWLNTVDKEINESDCGILCITKENQHAQWLNFEAGALWKSPNNTLVYPLFIDLELTDYSTGPIPAIFQTKKYNKNEIKELCNIFSDKIGLKQKDFERNFEALWKNIENDIKNDFIQIKEEKDYGFKISNPTNNEIVNNPIKVSGTYKIKPPNNTFRIIEVDPGNGEYWPKDRVTFDETNMTWNSKISIGGDFNKKRKLMIVALGKNGEALMNYSRKTVTKHSWFPIDPPLTSDTLILAEVMVTIKLV